MRNALMLTLLVLWLLVGQALAAGVTVTVNPETMLMSGQMSLGDLAVISGDDADRVKALRELKLGNAPLPGTRLALTADMLAARLTTAGADLNSGVWQIPPMVTISTTGQTVESQTLLAMAAEAVKQRLATSDSADVVVSELGAGHGVIVPAGQLSYKVELPYGIRFVTPTTANVIVCTDGHPYATVSVKLTVKAYRNVVVAARNLAPYEPITSDSLRLERWDIGHLTGYITDADKLVGLRTRRPVPAGVPFSEAAVERPPVVRHGSAVTILAEMGGIIVSANGQALQEGSVGSVIRVQNLNSNKIVNARVIDGATVQVIIYNGR
ncbi:MAG: flagellar basal body P-ring formation chaperone FlgA [Negativicutes bacterium]|nr:flagellar basal body P-ring formation chaperone FlgA [Negativicutes bacterium]